MFISEEVCTWMVSQSLYVSTDSLVNIDRYTDFGIPTKNVYNLLDFVYIFVLADRAFRERRVYRTGMVMPEEFNDDAAIGDRLRH